MLHLENFWRSPKSLLFMSNGPQDLKVFLLTMHKSRLVICHGKFHTGSPPQVVKYYQGTTIVPLQQNDNSNYSPMGL